MEESVTYREIIEKGIEKGIAKGVEQGLAQGRQEAIRNIILRQGTQKFQGLPSPEVRHYLDSHKDIQKLESLADRLLLVSSWEELIQSLIK